VKPETWILDASPVITLAKAGYLQLLDQLATNILIPEAVFREILAAPPSDLARRALESGWGERTSPREIPPSILKSNLGHGESAVLALAVERPGCVSVLDDSAPRGRPSL
jgi:predicted nucleic acid-binding protein